MISIEKILTEAIDRTIAVISPERALRRHLHRELLNKRSNYLYAAAKTTRLTGAWSIANPDVNDVIGMSAPPVRSRVRQLVRDFPYFGRAVNNMVDYTVGQGIMFQSKVKNTAAKLDKKRIQDIEDAFKWWSDEADISGKLHFNEIVRLAKRQDVEAGEFIIAKVMTKAANRYLPLGLQIYEADWLSSAHDSYGSGIGISATDPAGKETRQGVEYEKLTGRVTGYWFQDPNYGSRDVYIPASQVIHGFDMLRPQQIRGISPLAPGVMVAHDLADYMDTEIDCAKLAAKYLAFVKMTDPTFRQNALLTSQTKEDGTTQQIENMENAIIEYLRPGEEIEIAKNERPGTTFSPFVRLILTMLSVTTGVPYELLSGDYQGLNFSTARIVRNDFQQQLRPISGRHIRQMCFPAMKEFMDTAVLTGKLSLPGYFQNPRRYWEGEWTPPGMEAVDPLRDAKSQIESISFGLKSPQEVARERGRDLEDVYNEISAAKDMAKDLGLTFIIPSTAEKNNPAAVIDQ